MPNDAGRNNSTSDSHPPSAPSDATGEGQAASENAHASRNPDSAPTLDRRAARATPPSWYSGVVDRRSGIDRRDIPLALNASNAHPQGASGADTGLERRRGAGRRLSDTLRAAEDGSLTREQFLFVKAIDAFKQANACTFPAWTDVLEVIRLLGYRKTAQSELHLPACEDWLEKPDAPANVRPKGFERRTNRAA